MEPRTIPASQFKQRCLALLDQVKDDQVSYVVTKHGEPVAIVTPLPKVRQPLKGSVTYLTDKEEDLFSTGDNFFAEEGRLLPDDDDR